MIDHKSIIQEINDITAKLIRLGLTDQQNYPSCIKTGENQFQIGPSNGKDLAVVLKNVDYADIYNVLDQDKNFILKMLDGALVQFMYRYEDSVITYHRLAFFPSPFLEHFQNEPEIYETDEIYADIIARNILPVPIRFDYDPVNHTEIDHPQAHLTLGQFKNCRIPVCSPITPSVFMLFILRSFYNTAFRKFFSDLTFPVNLFEETITVAEKKLLHVAISA
jgi:hypothetical protein